MSARTWVSLLPRALQFAFAGRPTLQKVAASTGWLFLERIVRIAVGLFVGAWVTRYLGPKDFGAISYATAFVALFSTIATLGLDEIVVRDIVREAELKFEVLGSAFLLKAVAGTIVAVITVAVIGALEPSHGVMIALVGVGAFANVFLAFDTIELWFRSQMQSEYVAFARGCAFLALSCGKVLLILAHAPLVCFAWAGAAETALAALGLVVLCRRSGAELRRWRWNKAVAARLLRDSWPLIFSGIVIMIYMRIDQIMLARMVGAEEVGIYSVAVRVAEVWYFIPMTIVAAVSPAIIAAKQVSDELFYERLQQLYNLMALLAYLVAIPMALLSKPIIIVLFGASYAKAGPMLAVLIWAGMFTNLGVARSVFLSTMNWAKVHFMTVLLGSIINVALNFLLIPAYGGMGAVIASCVAYWFAAHGACFVYRPLFRTGFMLTKAMLWPKVWK